MEDKVLDFADPNEKLNEDLNLKKLSKNPWLGSPEIKTRTELIRKRKKELLPDPSFDIDKDGHVSSLDFFVAKIFDEDKDGKLNATERAKAEDALKNGYLDRFKLGLESSGPDSLLRTIQKRGVIIQGDDTSKILQTYPIIKHVSLPSITSRSELINTRKHIQNAIKPFETAFRFEKLPVIPEGYVPNPKFNSISDIKSAFTQTLRNGMGMTAPTDIKNTKIPTTEYIKSPKYSSKTEMQSEKKKELLENLHSKANYNYFTRDQHLLEREKYLISHSVSQQEGLTINKIKEKEKKENNEYNSKTFSNLSIGVHGKELPKFSGTLNEFWKARNGYKESPAHNSNLIMTLTKRNSGLIDKYCEADITSRDYFEYPHVRLDKKKTDLADKPNHTMPYGQYTPVEATESDFKSPQHTYRLSNIMGYFLESAAEMGIQLVEPAEPVLKMEKSKSIAKLETSVLTAAAEVPKTSSSIKKTFNKTVGPGSFRTTGFIKKQN